MALACGAACPPVDRLCLGVEELNGEPDVGSCAEAESPELADGVVVLMDRPVGVVDVERGGAVGVQFHGETVDELGKAGLVVARDAIARGAALRVAGRHESTVAPLLD